MAKVDEKRFKALGQNWTARFDFNAQCDLEDRTGIGFFEFVSPMMLQLDEDDADNQEKIMEAVTGLRVSDLRLVLFFSLAGQHEEMTEKLAGEIIQDLGGVVGALEILAWAIMQAMPADGDEDGEKGGATSAANPPKNRQTRRAAKKRGSA